MQPAVCIHGLLCHLSHVEVTHEDVSTPEADFTDSLLVWVIKLGLAAWDLLTTALGKHVFRITTSRLNVREFLLFIMEIKMYLVILKAVGIEIV